MSGIRHIVRRQDGIVLPLVLVLLVVGSLLIVPALTFGSTSLKSEQVAERKAKEMYAADAGVQDALWQIEHDTFSLPSEGGEVQWSLDQPVNQKSVEVKVAHVQDTVYRIRSTAQEGASSTVVESYVEILPGTSALFGSAIAVTDGSLTNIEGSVVNGDLYVNGDVKLEDAEINGDVYATGSVDDVGGTCNGTITEGGSAWNFTLLDPADYRPNCQDVISLEGPYTVAEDTVWDDAVCVDGDLKIEEGVDLALNGNVWVTGNITVEGQESNHVNLSGTGDVISETGNIWIEFLVTDDMDEIPLIWAVQGDISVQTNMEACVKAFLYAPEGSITLEDSTCVYGAIFAQNVVKVENTVLHYPGESEMGEYGSGTSGSIARMTYTIG